MNRGPTRGRSRADFVSIAAGAWAPPPDWVSVLAAEATRSTGAGVAARIGYSPAVVSDVIRNKYRGDIGRVEHAVRGALMGATVGCEVLGEIGRVRCLAEQDKPFRATSNLTVRLYHACRGACPHALRNRATSDGDAVVTTGGTG